MLRRDCGRFYFSFHSELSIRIINSPSSMKEFHQIILTNGCCLYYGSSFHRQSGLLFRTKWTRKLNRYRQLVYRELKFFVDKSLLKNGRLFYLSIEFLSPSIISGKALSKWRSVILREGNNRKNLNSEKKSSCIVITVKAGIYEKKKRGKESVLSCFLKFYHIRFDFTKWWHFNTLIFILLLPVNHFIEGIIFCLRKKNADT